MRSSSWRIASLLLAMTVTACGSETTAPEDPPVPVVTSVAVAPNALELTEGGQVGQLTATVQTDQGPAASPTVSWSSSDASVAGVSGSGVSVTVAPLAPGSAVISASTGGVTATATVVVKPGPKTLVVAVAGEGTVSADVSGLTCQDGACQGTFPFGTAVGLTAEPGTDHRVERWGGACSGSGATCSVVMDSARTVTLAFEAKVEENGLSREINDIVPDTLLDDMIAMGMPIHSGARPPSIEGTYLMSPAVRVATSVPGDYITNFADFYLQFTDQDDTRLTVTSRTAQYGSNDAHIGEGMSTYIVGSDSTFSVFARIVGVDSSNDTTYSLQVYSGRLVQGGVRDLYLAFYMLDNQGHAGYIPNGTGRIVKDQDGLSPVTAFPAASGARAAAPVVPVSAPALPLVGGDGRGAGGPPRGAPSPGSGAPGPS